MWQVQGFHDGIWLILRSSFGGLPELPPQSEVLANNAATSSVDAWFPEGPGENALLHEVVAALGFVSDDGFAPVATAVLKETIRRALDAGLLRAVRVRVGTPAGKRLDVIDDDPNDGPAPQQKVNPLIDVEPVVLVKRPYTKPKRQPIRLTADIAFDGKAKLTRSSDAIDLYDAAVGGKKLAFDGKDNEFAGDKLGPGVVLYAEGVKPSAAIGDVVFELTLTGGSKPVGPPAKDKMTAVELTLEICGPRPDGGGEPPVIATPDKFDKGRYLLPQKPNPAALDAALEEPHLRAKVIVKKAKPEAWDGELSLSGAGGARLKLFAKEVPEAGEAALALPVVLKNADIPADGHVVWAEGAAVSADLRDAGLTLGAKDIDAEGDKVSATVLDVVLEVCQARTAAPAAGDPAVFTADDKIKKGRYLHKQDGTKSHGRAMLIIKKVKPEAFDGTLSLAPINASVAAYDAEDPAGGAKLANPYEVANTAIPADGKKVFAQGESTSGALRDTGFRLTIKDHLPKDGDRVNVSVVEITEIKATIKSTPANTARPGAVAPLDHEFKATSASPDFAVNLPLVLMRNAQPDILLVATVAPVPGNLADLPMKWQAVRNDQDHASIGGEADLPTLGPDPLVPADPRRANLNANAKGSFRIRPYFPATTAGKYSKFDKEPSIPLQLVLADATVVADASTANVGTLTATINAGSVGITNGSWTAGLPGAGMAMDLTSDVVGGGADGLLGLDKVFAGFINDLRNVDIVATYTDSTVAPAVNHTLINVYVSNRAQATGAMGTTPVFQAGDPAPASHAYPILDTGRPGGGLGGDTATMTRSTIVSKNPRPLGQRWRITCIDSPGRGFPKNHPIFAAAVLSGIHYRHQFRGAFSFWTNFSGVIGATGDPTDRVYSVIRVIPWEMTGDWTVNYAAVPPTLTVVNPHTGNSAGATVAPIGRAQDHALEVRPPSGITTGIAFDGRV